jgi:hypothetical protein
MRVPITSRIRKNANLPSVPVVRTGGGAASYVQNDAVAADRAAVGADFLMEMPNDRGINGEAGEGSSGGGVVGCSGRQAVCLWELV